MAGLYLNHVKVAEESGGVVSLPNTVQFNNLKIGGTEVINSNRQIQNITGIDFGSSTDGTGTVSGGVLDDYEEGTWNPGITGKEVTSSEGTYTKIGRQVLVRFELNGMNSSISGSGVSISNLPFTAANLNINGIAILGDISGITFTSGYGETYGRIGGSASSIQIMQKAPDGSTHTGLSNLNSSFTIRGYALYTT